MLSFPQTRASLRQIMISWQLAPCTVCTSHIGYVGPRLIGTHNSYTPCCRMKNRVYGQVWGALVATIEGVPVADYDFMAVWTVYCMHQPYWVDGSKGYLVHITHIPALLWNQNCIYGLISDAVVPTNKVVPVADYVWPPNCMQQQYWVRGFKGYLVHIAHIPALPWNQNSAYGLVWDAVVATNGDVPVADYDFVAVWTLYCMCKPYWFCGSKGYLVHKAHIPAAMEFKVAYMAKFVVPSVPQTRASLWQIMILWQFGPCTVCNSHIGYVVSKVIWYPQLIYPLL